MKNKLKFFEIVNISDENINKEIGVIVGMAQCDDGSWVYDVDTNIVQNDDGSWVYDVDNDEGGWSTEEQYLSGTGMFMKREDFYGEDPQTIRVGVNEKGEGFIIDD